MRYWNIVTELISFQWRTFNCTMRYWNVVTGQYITPPNAFNCTMRYWNEARASAAEIAAAFNCTMRYWNLQYQPNLKKTVRFYLYHEVLKLIKLQIYMSCGLTFICTLRYWNSVRTGIAGNGIYTFNCTMRYWNSPPSARTIQTPSFNCTMRYWNKPKRVSSSCIIHLLIVPWGIEIELPEREQGVGCAFWLYHEVLKSRSAWVECTAPCTFNCTMRYWNRRTGGTTKNTATF